MIKLLLVVLDKFLVLYLFLYKNYFYIVYLFFCYIVLIKIKKKDEIVKCLFFGINIFGFLEFIMIIF